MRAAASRRGTLAPIAAIAVAAIVLILIVVANVLRPSSTQPGGFASASPTATASASQQAVASSARTSSAAATPPTSTAATAVRPDARHGVIVATGNLRTEDDPRGLQQPSLFLTAPGTTYAGSPDGKRIALIRTSQTGQQIVTFTTARPSDITVVADLAGSGELATHVVWAGDGSDSILVSIGKGTPGQPQTDVFIWDYSTLRSIETTTRGVREIARVSGQSTMLWPLAWLPARQLAGALEARSSGGVTSYVTIRGSALERTTLNVTSNLLMYSASRDGVRVLVTLQSAIRWWPVDQPAAAKDLAAPSEALGHAEFRPGTDEIGVDRVGPAGQFEIWTLTGQRRVVAPRVVGFIHWRVDGTAAIASSDPTAVLLIDPASGATTPLPGGGFPVADVVMF